MAWKKQENPCDTYPHAANTNLEDLPLCACDNNNNVAASFGLSIYVF
jgi:hypothetical protein